MDVKIIYLAASKVFQQCVEFLDPWMSLWRHSCTCAFYRICTKMLSHAPVMSRTRRKQIWEAVCHIPGLQKVFPLSWWWRWTGTRQSGKKSRGFIRPWQALKIRFGGRKSSTRICGFKLFLIFRLQIQARTSNQHMRKLLLCHLSVRDFAIQILRHAAVHLRPNMNTNTNAREFFILLLKTN